MYVLFEDTSLYSLSFRLWSNLGLLVVSTAVMAVTSECLRIAFLKVSPCNFVPAWSTVVSLGSPSLFSCQDFFWWYIMLGMIGTLSVCWREDSTAPGLEVKWIESALLWRGNGEAGRLCLLISTDRGSLEVLQVSSKETVLWIGRLVWVNSSRCGRSPSAVFCPFP